MPHEKPKHLHAIDIIMIFEEKKRPRQRTDAAKVGRKRLKSGVTGETSHEHFTNMTWGFIIGKRKIEKK